MKTRPPSSIAAYLKRFGARSDSNFFKGFTKLQFSLSQLIAHHRCRQAGSSQFLFVTIIILLCPINLKKKPSHLAGFALGCQETIREKNGQVNWKNYWSVM